MKSFGCTPQSWPQIPDSTTHQLWQSWDMALESFLTQYVSLTKGTAMTDPRNNVSFNMPTNLTFFNDQLSAFEMWLEYGTATSPSPPQLPVVLQVLLSQSHRMRALQLLKRFLALGSEAIKLSLILGIFPYILKLLQNPADDIKQTLISIWATVVGFDSSCRQELVREKSQICFVQCITSKSVSVEHRSLAAFVLAEVCNGFKEGQASCLQLGLHRSCTSIIGQPEVTTCSILKLWTCLCMFKLCEDFVWAKYLCITEAGHTQLYPLLIDLDPTVRTAAVLALGELFGASALVGTSAGTSTPGSTTSSNLRQMRPSISSTGSGDGDSIRNFGSNSMVEEKDLREAELQLALQILECCTDGSVMVRLEAIYALSKFFVQPAHIDCIKIVAKALYSRNTEKKQLKVERRSASPPNPNDPLSKNGSIYPWHLTPLESKDITAQVEAYMRSQMDDSCESSGVSSILCGEIHGLESREAASGEEKVPNPDLVTLMASAYVRLWLALTEVQGKDSHALVAQAAATIRFRVHALIAIDERNIASGMVGSSMDRLRSASNMSLGNSFDPKLTFSPTVTNGFPPNPPTDNKLRRPLSDNNIRIDEDASIPPAIVPPMSPMGVGVLSSPSGNRAKNVKFGSKMPRSSPFLVQPEGQLSATGSFDFAALATNGLPPPNSASTSLNTPGIAIANQGKLFNSTSPPVVSSSAPANSGSSSTAQPLLNGKPILAEAFKDYAHLTEDDLLVCFSSNHYEMAKRQFMEPYLGYEPYQDPLSGEAKIIAYRIGKLKEIIQNDRVLYELFRDVEERPADMLASLTLGGSGRSGIGKAGTDDSKAPSVTASSVPNNLCKFEQKNSLYMDSPMSSSLVMFHSFQDILIVASDSVASVWSLTNHSKIMEVKNRHTVKPGFAGDGISSLSQYGHQHTGTPGRNVKTPNVVPTHADNSLFSPQANNSRITAMQWINESYDPLLLLGSDDGVVKVWRDVSCSDNGSFGGDHAVGAGGNVGTATRHDSPTIAPNSNIELATAFAALPDIAETTRGSGLVLSWQQSTGTLIAGGNSNTVRVWDLGREQNVRVFHTGVETCLTALASTSISNQNPFNSHNQYSVGDIGSTLQTNPVSWIFAGFADGSVGVYDERVHTNGGRVHLSHTHSNWVNHAHMRLDVPEILIGSVRGTVKFWDLRTMRTYKTLEIQKSPLTSLAVHNSAPIMASGSHAQFIKILTLGGEQLGNIIKYYDGFLGQRIGPVSCLAFHPHRLLLASSSTDGIVSLYGASDK